MPSAAIVVCSCHARYRVLRKSFGKRLRCRSCGNIIQVPVDPSSERMVQRAVPLSGGLNHQRPRKWLWRLISGTGGAAIGFGMSQGWDWLRSVNHGHDDISGVHASVKESDKLLSRLDQRSDRQTAPGSPDTPSLRMQETTPRLVIDSSVSSSPVKQFLPADSVVVEHPGLDRISDHPRPIEPEKRVEPANESASAGLHHDNETAPVRTRVKPAAPDDDPTVQTFDEALKLAQQLDKPILLLFFSERCSWCRKMKAETLTDSIVRNASRKFVTVTIDADDPANTALKSRYAVKGLPTYVVADREGRTIRSGAGFEKEARVFAEWLDNREVWQAMNAAKTAAQSPSKAAMTPHASSKKPVSRKKGSGNGPVPKSQMRDVKPGNRSPAGDSTSN